MICMHELISQIVNVDVIFLLILKVMNKFAVIALNDRS